MKQILTLILILVTLIAIGQPVRETSPTSVTSLVQRGMFGRNLYKPKVAVIPTTRPSTSSQGGVDSIGAVVFCTADSSDYTYVGGDIWLKQKPPPVDFSNYVSHSALTDTLQSYVKIQTASPTASLSGGVSQERVAAGANLTYTLNWTAGRLSATSSVAATTPLATITVNSTAQSFTSPSAGNNVTGTQTVSIARNTNVSISMLVTTTDGKTAGASTGFSFYDKRYVGWSTTTIPSNSTILAGHSDNYGGSWNWNYTLSQLSSDEYLFIANTTPISSIYINGFPSEAAFNLNNSITVTNASGGSTTYYISVSKLPFGSSGNTSLILN